MMSRKMTQPRPTAAKQRHLGVEEAVGVPATASIPPEPLFSSWFTVSVDGGGREKGQQGPRDTWQILGPAFLQSFLNA